MLENSRKLRRLHTHRSRQHSNSSNWDNRNLDTDDFYETNLTINKNLFSLFKDIIFIIQASALYGQLCKKYLLN